MLEKGFIEYQQLIKVNLTLCMRGTIDAMFILRRMQEEY